MDPPRIQYEGVALQFPARVEKAPPGIFKAAIMAGGSRLKKQRSNKTQKKRGQGNKGNKGNKSRKTNRKQ
jgi:hypothetical protein